MHRIYLRKQGRYVCMPRNNICILACLFRGDVTFAQACFDIGMGLIDNHRVGMIRAHLAQQRQVVPYVRTTTQDRGVIFDLAWNKDTVTFWQIRQVARKVLF